MPVGNEPGYSAMRTVRKLPVTRIFPCRCSDQVISEWSSIYLDAHTMRHIQIEPA